MIRLEDISVKAVNGDSEIDILDNISVSFEEGNFCITDLMVEEDYFCLRL